jgi:hypothetical protein
MHLPMLRNPAASSLGGLTIAVMIAVAMPSLYHIQASQKEPLARPEVQEAARPAPPAPDEKKALEAFLQTYRLAPGQNLKLVPPPRPQGIRIWYARKDPRKVDRLDDARAMVFGWRGPDQLRIMASMFGGKEGWAIQDLPRRLNMDIEPVQIEGDPELLKTEVAGDWIVRQGVPAEQLLPPLEAILQRALRLRITLALRRVERDVVVARGRYRPSPLPGHAEGELEVYSRKFDRDDDGASGVGSFPAFLRWTGEWIGRPIVNEVETPPKANVSWHVNERDPSTEQTRREDRDEAMVLKHLQEQTGLTFTREKRPMRILFVERPRSEKKP